MKQDNVCRAFREKKHKQTTKTEKNTRKNVKIQSKCNNGLFSLSTQMEFTWINIVLMQSVFIIFFRLCIYLYLIYMTYISRCHFKVEFFLLFRVFPQDSETKMNKHYLCTMT